MGAAWPPSGLINSRFIIPAPQPAPGPVITTRHYATQHNMTIHATTAPLYTTLIGTTMRGTTLHYTIPHDVLCHTTSQHRERVMGKGGRRVVLVTNFRGKGQDFDDDFTAGVTNALTVGLWRFACVFVVFLCVLLPYTTIL